MKINYANKIYQFKIYIIAFSAFLALNPFFLWETYYIDLISYYRIFLIISILCLVTLLKTNEKKFYIAKRDLVLITFFIVLYIYTMLYRYNESVSLNSIFTFFFIIVFILSPVNIKSDVFIKFRLIFILFLVPSILFFLLHLIGINLSADVIKSPSLIKSNYGTYYKHNLGSLIIINEYKGLFRMSGMFDEPGLIGTVAGFFFISMNFKI